MSIAFVEGLIAGYGIAIPVGAIAVLILEISLRRGFRFGLAAGGGAAAADTFYALTAVLVGASLAPLLAPVAGPIRILSGIALLGIGGYGLWAIWRRGARLAAADYPSGGALKTFFQFLGLTLINPLTVIYFSALILGGGGQEMDTARHRAAFVLGAGLASLSWQSLLAGLGALGHARLGPRFQRIVSVVGYLIVIGFGARILLGR